MHHYLLQSIRENDLIRFKRYCNEYLHWRDNNGNTLLIFCIRENTSIEIINSFIHKIDINQSNDSGMTALMWSFKNHRENLIPSLLKNEPNFLPMNKEGLYAMDFFLGWGLSHVKKFIQDQNIHTLISLSKNILHTNEDLIDYNTHINDVLNTRIFNLKLHSNLHMKESHKRKKI